MIEKFVIIIVIALLVIVALWIIGKFLKKIKFWEEEPVIRSR